MQSLGDKIGASQAVTHSLQLEPNFCRALAWSCDQALAKKDKPLARFYFTDLLQASRLKMTDDTLDDYSRGLQSIDPVWVQKHAELLKAVPLPPMVEGFHGTDR